MGGGVGNELRHLAQLETPAGLDDHLVTYLQILAVGGVEVINLTDRLETNTDNNWGYAHRFIAFKRLLAAYL